MSEELLIKIGVENKNATAQIRALENSVKSLDRQLKLTSGSGKTMEMSLSQLSNRYTLLSNKMKYLQTELRSYKTRLSEANENIKRQQDLMKELADAGEENSTAYNKAASSLSKYKQEAERTQNGMAELQAKIQLCNQELENTQNIMRNHSLIQFGLHTQQLGSSLQETGVKIQNVGRGIETVGHTIGTLSMPFTLIAAGAASAAIAYEDAFAGVRKTVDATEQQFGELSNAIREMSKEMPTSANEIAAVAEAAGQLGIHINSIEDFTKVMVMLGDTTNISCTEAAVAMAKFMNVTGNTDSTTEEYTNKVERLASVLVHLGNNTATTEQDIMNMATRLASAGHQVGMSEQEIFALAAALSSIGLEAEMGGSAFSKLMVKMQVACEEGGEALADFEKIAGPDFKETFEKDAYGAMMKFVEGLAAGGEQGESAIKMLTDMGIEEVRLRDAILRSTNANELFANVLELANEAFEENSALSDEAAKRYETVASKIEIFKNRIYDLGIQLGEALLPHIEGFINKAEELVDWFANLDEGTQGWILKMGILLPVIAGGVTILGSFVRGIGSVVTGVGSFVEVLGKAAIKLAGVNTLTGGAASAISTVGSASGAAASGLSTIASTAGAASSSMLPLVGILAGAAAAVAAVGVAWWANEKKIEKGTETLRKSAGEVEDFTGKLRTQESIWTEMFGKTYSFKFSDEYKTNLAQVETDVEAWVERLKQANEHINEILNNTEISNDTKQEQIHAILDPISEEISTKTQEIQDNLSTNSNNLKTYLVDTLGMTENDANRVVEMYSSKTMESQLKLSNNLSEMQTIIQGILDGTITDREAAMERMAELEQENAEYEKDLVVTNGEDIYNLLEKQEAEKQVLKDMSNKQSLDNLNKSYDEILEADKKYYDEKRKQVEDSLTLSDEEKKRTIENLNEQQVARKEASDLYHDLRVQNMSSDQQWLEENNLTTRTIGDNENQVMEVVSKKSGVVVSATATSIHALKEYAREHGYSVDTVIDQTGQEVMVTKDAYGNITGYLYNEIDAYQKYSGNVANYMKDYCESVKNGSMTTDQAMAEVEKALANGTISAQDFGFATDEEFLRCARSALDAEGDVSKMQATINDLHGKEVTVHAEVTGTSQLQTTKELLDSLRSKTVNVHYTTSGSTVVQPTRGGAWTINEQGTHGDVGASQLARVNESVRGSRSWELIDGPHTYLGSDEISDKVLLGQGASVKSNTTSTAMMIDAVQKEVQKQLTDVYLDYAFATSPLSRMAFDVGSPQQTINNNTNFDDSNVVNAIYEVLKALTGINFNPTISFSPKQLAKSIAPHMDKELQWRSSRR